MSAACATLPWLESALAPLSRVRVAVMGDFCLDAYWHLDTGAAELSIETGLPVRRVRTQRYSLGGAGNVIANLIALNVAEVRAIGVVGPDLFGQTLLGLLEEQGVDAGTGMVVDPGWQTMVYAKPFADGREESRIDFGAFNAMACSTADRLIEALEEAAAACDAVILNQQVPGGAMSAPTIERINASIARFPRTRFLADARDRPELFRGAALKLNAGEAARMLGKPAEAAHTASEARQFALGITRMTGQPAFVTRGEGGIVAADGEEVHELPGIQAADETDPVGAGDTVVAVLAAALGSNQSPFAAARLANLAASVTARKLGTTGTATPAEILAAAQDAEYIFEPELAEAPHLARYLGGTNIEQIRSVPRDLCIEHCIFDHDGTLSTLREGWEGIMEPMMVRAILGPEHEKASPAAVSEVAQKVRRFIDRTTGIQTLVQMKGLADLVRQGGHVPEDEILDEHGYKRVFNEQLMRMVSQRMGKLQSGELTPADFQIENAALFVKELYRRGVKLYLASGTDTEDVLAEAKAMGYAEYFEGRIFGAVGDLKAEAKKMVLEGILRDYDLAGHQFATFGDGPVEIRETEKRGGLAIGVASDEVRRSGWNYSKRSRLIRAGASLLVPDFSQLSALLAAIALA